MIGKGPLSRTLVGRTLRAALLTLIGLALLYLVAAIVGALVPRNPRWEEPSNGILIFVRSNGVHADLVLPATAGGIDLYRLVPPDHIPDRDAGRGWIAFGWGQREFYLETPRWVDLSGRNAIRAVFGGKALLHVEHGARPQPSGMVRPLQLEEDSYRKLVEAIRMDFVTGADGRPIPLTGRGYGSNDVFYEARGRYNAFRTSNQWTVEKLAEANVTIGLWSPFAQGIMWRFHSAHEGDHSDCAGGT